jgi:ABC-type transporter MlaC component
MCLLGVFLLCGIPATPARSDPAAASVDSAAEEFVAGVNRIISQYAAGSDTEPFCASLINSSFDFETLARMTSAGTWDEMNAQQQTAYRAAFLRRAGKDCALLSSDPSGGPLTALGIRVGEEGDRLIATQSGQRGQGRIVVWRVRADGDSNMRAVDVIVDGHSMAIAARDDAKAILSRSNGSVDELITSLGQ